MMGSGSILCGALLGLGLVFSTVAGVRSAEPDKRPHVSVPGGLQGKSCYECHVRGRGIVLPSEESPRKYSKSWAYATYLESTHGRLRTLGDRNQPLCEDCHLTREWSDILPVEHPNSPVNPANLPRICAKCHGESMLTANVAAGSMHLELGARPIIGAPLESRYGFMPGVTKREESYYVGPIDLVAFTHYALLTLTALTMMVLAVYMVLDMMRKLVERRSERLDRNDEKR